MNEIYIIERKHTMKKNILLSLIVLCLVTLISCTKNETVEITLPFDESEITAVEAYYYVAPSEATKKEITDSSDFSDIYSDVFKANVSTKESEDVAGGETYCLKFYLSDSTEYIIQYYNMGVKNGRIISSDFNYFTTSDLSGIFYGNYDYEELSITETDLPVF